MRAPVSIVIPTLNAATELPPTLGALGDGLQAGILRELVITDGGSTDDTQAITEQAGALWISGPPGRGGQLKRGVGVSDGSWLLILHADTHLGEGWADVALNHITNAPDKAGFFCLAFRAKGIAPRLVAGWANLRSRLFGLPYGDQALLISRDLYDSVGGFADIPLMEDVAIARALRGKLTRLDATAYTSAARYQTQGWLKRGSKNLLTLIRYMFGADPAKLSRVYIRK